MAKKTSAAAPASAPTRSPAASARASAKSGGMHVFAHHAALPLFALASTAFDASVQVYDTLTGSLRHNHSLAKGATVSALAWLDLAPPHDGKTKKRKTSAAGRSAAAEPTLAIGLASGDILLYSPAQDSITARLAHAHSQAVIALAADASLVSCGLDRQVIEWDLAQCAPRHSLTPREGDPSAVAVAGPFVVCGTYSALVYALSSADSSAAVLHEFSAHAEAITRMAIVNTDGTNGILFATSAIRDRFVNAYAYDGGKARVFPALVAQAEVSRVIITRGPQHHVIVVTVDGAVELFAQPFSEQEDAPGAAKSRKAATRRSVSRITVVSPSGAPVEVLDVAQSGPHRLTIAYKDGLYAQFRQIDVETGDGVLIPGDRELVSSSTPKAHGANGDKSYREGDAMVGTSRIIVERAEIAEDQEDQEEDESDAEMDNDKPTLASKLEALTMSKGKDDEATVGTAVATVGATGGARGSSKTLSAPTAGSLTTVLAQALKSGDRSMLEFCFNTHNDKIVMATVQRLDAALSIKLLDALTERLARKPLRAPALHTWVRALVVAHGGYLATIPDLMQQVAELHATLSARAANLPRLLALQGRLEMINAQIELRRQGAANARSTADGADAQDESNVTEYIEGQSSGESDDESEESGEMSEESDAEDEHDVDVEDTTKIDKSDYEDDESNAEDGMEDVGEDDSVDNDDDEDDDEDDEDDDDDDDDESDESDVSSSSE